MSVMFGMRFDLRNPAFAKDGVDFHTAADLTAQANHLGVTLSADIIKQKLPTLNGGYNAIPKFGKTHKKVYGDLVKDHPVDWEPVRDDHQVGCHASTVPPGL